MIFSKPYGGHQNYRRGYSHNANSGRKSFDSRWFKVSVSILFAHYHHMYVKETQFWLKVSSWQVLQKASQLYKDSKLYSRLYFSIRSSANYDNYVNSIFGILLLTMYLLFLLFSLSQVMLYWFVCYYYCLCLFLSLVCLVSVQSSNI